MTPSETPLAPARAEIIRWAASLGAVTGEALAQREALTLASARARLQAIVREELLVRSRPLADAPALYSVTRAGLRAAGVRGLDPCRVSAGAAEHAIACASAAAALERAYPRLRVVGERELRRDEREQGGPLASATLAGAQPRLHRPDLVLWSAHRPADLPVAVEIELTVKSPRRLGRICSAWARCRLVEGVLYVASPDALRALERALSAIGSRSRIALVPLATLATRPQPACA
jgi:hypothetical protein